MQVEREMRFCFPAKRLDEILKKINMHTKYLRSCHELTVMYDNPNPKYSFYSKKIDGRLRLRYSKSIDVPGDMPRSKNPKSQCILTWKRRLPNGRLTNVVQEEEIEATLSIKAANNMRAILEDVLKCRKVSSYERIRHFFAANSVEVTVDEFPYGVTVEIELKKGNDEDKIFVLAEELGFSKKTISKLSCDDMYRKLCFEQGTIEKSDILFSDKQMPKLR